MAMLAGPRRKQKVINLRAKNNDWSNDSNKFGQRMLEKMGWSSGKGLGAKENGIVEHVVARYKNDEKGLGFEDKNDQWTKHEDDFNALLANLSNAEGSEEKLHSGVSLEVKSKKSKARVHYHKFTRGKDLTRYSEKDLANIFGKKSLKEEEKIEEPLPEDVKTTEQVFTEKGSMEDYFKSKLANFKSKSNLMYSKSETDDNAEYTFKGFSTNTNESDENDPPAHQGFGFSFYNNSSVSKDTEKENGDADMKDVPEIVEESQKIKKKKKKNKRKDNGLEENNSQTEPIACENTEEICKQTNGIEDESKAEKKSKKKKKLNEEPLENDQLEETKPKKKKSKGNTSNDIECTQESIHSTQDVEQENYVPKKKKKRKNKNADE